MSFEINWETLQADGDQFSESIRAFLDNRFKEMTLPSYLKSISVTSFELGNIAPSIEIKRITDPFPEFYMDDDDDDDELEVSNENDNDNDNTNNSSNNNSNDSTRSSDGNQVNESNQLGSDVPSLIANSTIQSTVERTVNEPPEYQTDEDRSESSDHTSSSANPINRFSRFNNSFSSTNIYSPNNLHFPTSLQSGFLSGMRSPFHPQWQNTSHSPLHVPPLFPVISSSTPEVPATPDLASPVAKPGRENDIQLYLHIKYKGDIKVGIETTLLVNYPSPNFVSLPLKLTMTGLEMSSIAALAYIDRKIHFSFICDADDEGNAVSLSAHDRVEIIRDIKIDSEIGDQEGNSPVLRNVGKIERFLLERIRHLARDELAWPGWITIEI